MTLASIFPPLPGSGRDWELGSGWKESRILLGEKSGRLNFAEFRYCWGVSLSIMSVQLKTEELGSKDKRGLEGTWAIMERV
jgi:hypothetical protein